MKVKTLLNEINRLKDKYEDFLEWEIFTEQEHLLYPDDKDIIEEKTLAGWRFVFDSEGWVYKNCATIKVDNEEEGFFTIFEKDKAFTINNNY
jgi:hypothetical protein